MYKLTNENYVIKGDLRFSISDSPEYPNTNPHYLEYKQWLAEGGVPEPADAPSPQEQRERFKAERAYAVKAITVTTAAGHTFDGDEESQGRMARAILALPDGGTVQWVLHDNTVTEASASDLREALALAGAEQAKLWVQP